MIVRADATFAYTKLFSVVGDFALVVFRYELGCGYGSMDHCDAITASFRKVWPDTKLQKSREKKGLLNRKQESDDAIKPS
ncbi:hypothetical protein PHMEG_00022113 [Phytophthora megakarya]|uniref:Uncharacterized protein n=1 Tax=Phytophthora megakarya TaxID=4795 RepID=A0A225VLJ5_9STRA|nr:hypothetical protein PHMEG_00022113 [Phytophthora megakarya]